MEWIDALGLLGPAERFTTFRAQGPGRERLPTVNGSVIDKWFNEHAVNTALLVSQKQILLKAADKRMTLALTTKDRLLPVGL